MCSDLFVSTTAFIKHLSSSHRELLDPLDPVDPLAKMAPEEVVVRLALLVALVRLVLSVPLDLLERRDLLVLMVPL